MILFIALIPVGKAALDSISEISGRFSKTVFILDIKGNGLLPSSINWMAPVTNLTIVGKLTTTRDLQLEHSLYCTESFRIVINLPQFRHTCSEYMKVENAFDTFKYCYENLLLP